MSRRVLTIAVLAFLALEVLDVLTLAALLGTPGGREVNPLVEGLLVRLGMPFAVVAKAAVVVVFLVAVSAQSRDWRRYAMLLVGVTVAAVGAASNLTAMG